MRFLKNTAVVNGAVSFDVNPAAMFSLIPSRWSSSPRRSARLAGGFTWATEPPLTAKNFQLAVLAKGATSSSEASAPFGAMVVR